MNQPPYTTFYIVRHGQTDWNALGKVQGHTDIPLNKTGHAQATSLAKELRSIHFDLAFSSDLLRAKKTAEIIAKEHELIVKATEILRERFYAEHEGNIMKLTTLFEELTKDLSHAQKFRFKMTPGSESDEELINRIVPFIKECAIANPGKTVLIGTHGGVLGTLLLHLGYFTYENRKQFRIANAGYMILRSDGIDFFIDDVKGIEKRT